MIYFFLEEDNSINYEEFFSLILSDVLKESLYVNRKFGYIEFKKYILNSCEV